jgi:hypothetical protein
MVNFERGFLLAAQSGALTIAPLRTAPRRPAGFVALQNVNLFVRRPEACLSCDILVYNRLSSETLIVCFRSGASGRGALRGSADPIRWSRN